MARMFTEDEVRELIEAAVAPLLARIAELEAEAARLKKNSSTSSKPPSSDIVKPPRPGSGGGKQRKRRRGGQPGHTRQTRAPFPPEQVDHTWIYEWPESELAPDWEPLDEFRTLQQIELVEKLFEVTEYCARLYRSRTTGHVMAAPLPDQVRLAGLVGPRLTALLAFQKGACHMSYTSIQTFLEDVFSLPLSTGQIAKIIQKVSAALSPSHLELQGALPRQPVMNIDETGHPENGQRMWTWGFHVPGARGFTWFHVDPSRSTEVLYEFLGETFSGIIGCDYYGVYRKFLDETNAVMQVCWAHLIRDVKFLTTLSDPVTRRYGKKLLVKIKCLFRVWHRRGQMPAEKWERAARRAQEAVLQRAKRAPPRIEAQNIAQRFRDYGAYYFTFLKVPGVEPTNNGMEQRMRFVAIDRKITQGTRGERGRRWCERMWTVLATCVQQGRSAFQFIYESIVAHFSGHVPPSLLAMPP
ncbi:MAG: IS66 family transposase [Thermoguttaceae bacterium]